MVTRLIGISFAALLLAGCASMPGGTACDGWKPIRPTKADVRVISGGLTSSILSHNEHGARTCGWQAR